MLPKISLSNSKLGLYIPSINLPAGISCRPDAPCFKNGCYAGKGNFIFPNVKNSHRLNYEYYLKDNKGYFDSIITQLSSIPCKYFRWHSSGDIVDANYLYGMCRVARKYPQIKFLCFTKKYELVNEYLNKHKRPRNLILVFSNWLDFRCDNPHNLPTAWVKVKDVECNIPANAKECGGFCGACANTTNSCWDMEKGDAVYFHKH